MEGLKFGKVALNRRLPHKSFIISKLLFLRRSENYSHNFPVGKRGGVPCRTVSQGRENKFREVHSVASYYLMPDSELSVEAQVGVCSNIAKPGKAFGPKNNKSLLGKVFGWLKIKN